MTRDDDTPSPIPAPDDAADGAEKARARAFGDLVDKVIAGKAPAAVPADERALLEVATVIRAATRPVDLGAARTRSVVEAALATAIERKGRAPGALSDPSVPRFGPGGVVPLGRARAKRLAPWILAGVTSAVAAAAIVLLLVRSPHEAADAPVAPVAAAPLPEHLRSRPADPLVGIIAQAPSLDDAGAATVQRIDTIYADRLAGYRERTFSVAARRRSGGAP